jgi:hypothetical protein
MSNRQQDKSPPQTEPALEITTVPISSYAAYASIDADAAAARVVELLEQFDAEHVGQRQGPAERNQMMVNGWLADWATVSRPANAILFWVGHGESSFDNAWLAVHDTRVPMAGTAIKPEMIADHLRNQWARRRHDGTWAAVIVEACGAEQFVSLLCAELNRRPSDAPKRLLLFGAGGHGHSFLGSFSDGLRKALGSYTDWDEVVRLDDLMGRVRGYFTSAVYQTIDLFPPPTFRRRQVLSGGMTATMDVFVELQKVLRGLPDDERAHFVPKAQGAEQGELAWYFTGRGEERQRIFEWLRGSAGGLFVVTGQAGCGKSALLGNILVYCNPQLRQLLVQHGLIDDLAEVQRPPDNMFSSVIHLTGMTTADTIKRLLAEVDSEPTGENLNDWLEQLIALLQDRSRPFTLLADALDESQEPTSIAASVLRRIAGLPGCRVIVGTRRSTKEGPDQPDTHDQSLIDALGRNENTDVLEVERDPKAIGEYVRRRLYAAVNDSLLPAGAAIDEIVDLIQGKPGRQFLFARLAVHEILARPDLTRAQSRTELEELLTHDHRRLFAQAVARLTALNPVNVALLEALALSMGRGLPRSDRIWAIVAEALIDPPGTVVTEQDLDEILKTAAPYIMLDGEDGQSVYRLAHRTFQEHFVSGTGLD